MTTSKSNFSICDSNIRRLGFLGLGSDSQFTEFLSDILAISIPEVFRFPTQSQVSKKLSHFI